MLNASLKLQEVLVFVIDQETIAKELCVEKDIPNSCCAGKCHLTKEVKALENDGDSSTPLLPLDWLKIDAVPTDLVIDDSLDFYDSKTLNHFVLAFCSTELTRALFRPPIG